MAFPSGGAPLHRHYPALDGSLVVASVPGLTPKTLRILFLTDFFQWNLLGATL